MNFSGSWVAIVTPFTNKNQIDVQSLSNLLDWHIQSGTDGIVCLGTTGEGPTISDKERSLVIQTCLHKTKGNIPLIVNVGTNCTDKSVEYCEQAKKLGADAALVIVPYYNKPEERGIKKHFEKVAEVNLPIVLYHHPGRTGKMLSASFIAGLYNQGAIQAVKEASNSLPLLRELVNLTNMPILSGEDTSIVSFMENGGKGSISVTANLIPSVWKELISLCLQKQINEATQLFEQYKPVIETLFLEVNPQGIKFALSAVNRCLPNMRLPLVVPEKKNQEKIQESLNLLKTAELK